MSKNTIQFEAEVGRLLDIVANALYSDKEVFLRELISNASDACEHHRYKVLSDKSYKGQSTDYSVSIQANKENKTLTIIDNGIGMNEDDLKQNLGTIASSGTARLMEGLKSKSKASKGGDVSDMIGQFGVGFYAAFMVSEKVDVLTQKANEDKAFLWSSDGRTGYTIEQAEREEGRGTTITLHLKDDQLEYLEAVRLEHIVKTYSNHIAVPVSLITEGNETKALNDAEALWHKAKDKISQEEYEGFYKQALHGTDKPWMNLHWAVEGLLEYKVLLYIPSLRPFDLYDPRRQHHTKLYVKKVFITDNCEGLVPPYLRFLRGVVDSQDLPLNVSREMLQNNPMVRKIRSGIVKKVLGTIEKTADKDKTGYKDFIFNFGAVLKEGLYEDVEHRDQLFKVIQFDTTHDSENQSKLSDYVERMDDKQRAIYYMTGEQLENMRKSPYLEGFKDREIEVLLLHDSIDSFWLTQVHEFEGKPFKSVAQASDDLAEFDGKDTSKDKEQENEAEASNDDTNLGPLIDFISKTLTTSIREVRVSHRLSSSPVCLVMQDGDLDINMERLLRENQHLDKSFTRIMEINPNHSIIKGLQERLEKGEDTQTMKDIVWLLLDQARIVEGEGALNSADFAERLNRAIEQGFLAA